MLTHRRRRAAPALLATVLLAGAGGAAWALERDPPAAPSPTVPVSWSGFVGGQRGIVKTSDRAIVLLRTPSVAERIAHVGYATETEERAWTSQVLAAQRELLTTLALHGIVVTPDFMFARVVDGFSAVLDARATLLLERNPEVLGIYPVRAAFPASLDEQALAGGAYGPEGGHRPAVDLPGVTGRGVTVALLDTAVDLAQPYLHGQVVPGADVVGGRPGADTGGSPAERHGTELAGLVVGAGGPGGLHGVAPDATIFPIRVAGLQPDARGRLLVYARSDQLIAGLERAVDPNLDGDCHDAARVALVGVAEPFAAFADSPVARAVRGALALNTVVVAPAGNDGSAGPDFGSIAGPAGAPAAVAVGATDSRVSVPSARVVFRAGLTILFDRRVPLAGTNQEGRAPALAVATGGERRAGRAVVLAGGDRLAARAAVAQRDGAAAIVVAGTGVPAGALGVGARVQIPVVTAPAAAVRALLAARAAGHEVSVSVGGGGEGPNPGRDELAPFSSSGLAFDGGPKPDLAAPGVGLATAAPGTEADGTPAYVTVTGTSAAAAVAAGAAALIADLRPTLAGADLASALVGHAPGGVLDAGAGAATEVTAAPAALSFGVRSGVHRQGTRRIVVRNVSTRRLDVTVEAVVPGAGLGAFQFRIAPDRLTLAPGHSRVVSVTLTAAASVSPSEVGAVLVTPAGDAPLRVPFAVDLRAPSAHLLGTPRLAPTAFAPSDTSPALLNVRVGALAGGTPLRIVPASRLDLLLYDAAGRYLGLLARVRDLLPGVYSFGVTGRSPTSARLAPGKYELRLAAWPTIPADAVPSRARVRFRIE